ncbi:MAG: hypothetical protein HC888_03955 [Candidatus Competibacteraceae bacterium]|nr:hypothetical protein [Candidatus Competibacteraceae bacterium]
MVARHLDEERARVEQAALGKEELHRRSNMDLRTRLYEQVCQGFFLPPVDTHDGKPVPKKDWEMAKSLGYLPYLRDCTPFIIDDIAYEWEHTSVDLTDMRLAIPYNRCWFEWQSVDGNKKRGLMIHAYSWAEAVTSPWCHVNSNSFRRREVERWEPTVVVINRFLQDLDARVKGILTWDTQKELYLSNEGKIIHGYLGETRARDSYDIESSPLVATFAMGILSSASKRIEEVESTSGYSKKVAQKRGFSVVYKVLNVRPTVSRRRYINSREIDDNSKRLHGVRGHFRTYTKERPLFGKWFGQYYVRSHERGDPSEGVVIKTYNVHP